MPDAGGDLCPADPVLEGQDPDADLHLIARLAVGQSPASVDAAICAARSELRHSALPIVTPHCCATCCGWSPSRAATTSFGGVRAMRSWAQRSGLARSNGWSFPKMEATWLC